MARLPIIGSDADAWSALLNEFLRVSHDEDGALRGAVACLATIAALKNLTPKPDQCICVQGYHHPGDGGGGLFYWDVSASEAENGGTIIIPDSSPTTGRWKRLVEGPLSVKWFGAKGDGAGDDGWAIISACNALQATGGGKLVFPQGTYKVFSTDTAYTWLGNFRGLTGVQLIAEGATLAIDSSRLFTTSYGTAFRFSACQNILIDGFNVTGPVLDITSTAVKGVEFTRFLEGCSNVSMPHNKLQGVLAGVIIARAKEEPACYVSRNFHIGVLEVKQAFYGVNCQYAGDNVTIDTLQTDTVHRSYFVYGCRNHQVNVVAKDAYGADCLLASYNGSKLEDVTLSYSRQTDTTNSSDHSPGVWIQWKDGVAGTFRNIKIDLNVKYTTDAQTGANAVRISKMTTNGTAYDACDRGHILENLTISGIVAGTPHDVNYGAVAMDGLCKWGPGDFFRNIVLENLHIKDQTTYCTWFMGPFRNHLVCRNVRMPGTLAVSTNDAASTLDWQVSADNLDCQNLWTNQESFRPIERRYDGANYTIQKGYRGKVLSNKGATGVKIDSLPPSEAGLEFKFLREAAFEYRIKPYETDAIRGGDAGKFLALHAAGNYVHLQCFEVGIWEILSSDNALAYEP